MKAILCGTALIGSVVGDETTQQGGSHEQYMKQYADDYTKYTKQGSSPDASKQGGDYQQYMKQYAGDYQQYMKQGGSQGDGSQGDYQKYVKQYAGDYMKYAKQGQGAGQGSGQQSGDYQQYVKQYAGDYMKYAKQADSQGDQAAGGTQLVAASDAGSQVAGQGASQGDYQKYMKQYAGDYMKYAKQGDSKGSSQQGGDYQQYMKQYAGDYQQYMKQGGSKGSSGDYQQYMKQYAGDYMKDAKQADSQGDHAAAATQLVAASDAGSQVASRGASQGDYQKYMKQYAGDYMKYAKQGDSKGSSQQGGDYQQYMKQYAGDYQQYMKQGGKQYMKQYAADYQQYMNQGGSKGSSKGSQGDYQQYMKQYAGDYMKYMKQGGQSEQPMPLLAVSSGASACNTTKQLDAWRKDQESHLNYVPEAYRHFPMDAIEKEYKKNLARIEAANNETKADSSEADKPADSVAEPTPLFAASLPSADACNTTEQLDAWRKQQEGQLKYVPEAYWHFPMDNIEKEYKKNLARIAAANGETAAEPKEDEAASDEADASTSEQRAPKAVESSAPAPKAVESSAPAPKAVESSAPAPKAVDLAATDATQPRILAALAVAGVSVPALFAFVYRSFAAPASLPEYVRMPPDEV